MASQSFIATKMEHRPHSFPAYSISRHSAAAIDTQTSPAASADGWDEFEINESASRLNNKIHKTNTAAASTMVGSAGVTSNKQTVTRTASNGSTKSLTDTKRKTIVTDLELL